MTFHLWVRDGILMIAIGLRPYGFSNFSWAVRTSAATPLREKIIAWFCGGWFSFCGDDYAYYFATKEQAEHLCFLMKAYHSNALTNQIEETQF